MKSIKEIRVENLQRLIDQAGGRSAFTDKPKAQTNKIDYSYLGQLLNQSRGIGDKTARKLEEIAGKAENWLDNIHVINETPEKYKKDPDIKIKPAYTFNCQFVYWSETCDTSRSNNYKRELRTMSISENNLSENVYGVEIDSDIFVDYPNGSQLLIEPDFAPTKGDIIVISFNDNQKTLARYLPALGEIQIEPLERGMPGSKTLTNNDYTIHGVVIKAFIELNV